MTGTTALPSLLPKGLREWDMWLDQNISRMRDTQLLRSLRPVSIPQIHEAEKEDIPMLPSPAPATQGRHRHNPSEDSLLERQAIEVTVSEATYQSWLNNEESLGKEAHGGDMSAGRDEGSAQRGRRTLTLFSGNDYLGLSAHPAVRNAAAKVAAAEGLGPRASALVCGYTDHHRRLESLLADLKHTEECLLFPTGFAANMAVLTAVCAPAWQPRNPPARWSQELPPGEQGGAAESASTGADEDRDPHDSIAVFSDELNHASIIDGIRLIQRGGAEVAIHVYRHGDASHLDELLSKSRARRKVVVTDSLFSMDGDFAPMREIAQLRNQHGFLWVVDEAHATLVCGPRGGGAAEAFGVERDVDLHVGTLSKAVGCQGGFVTTSAKWKQWILSRGRAFIYSTALPIPIVAAAHEAIQVSAREPWRREALWARIRQFSDAVGIPLSSPIASLVIGGADEALGASRRLLLAGFHVPAIRPPTVREGSSRLRVTLSAAHSPEDVRALVAALPQSLLSKSRRASPPLLSLSEREGSRGTRHERINIKNQRELLSSAEEVLAGEGMGVEDGQRRKESRTTKSRL